MAIDDPDYFDDQIVAGSLKNSRQKRDLTLEQLSNLTKKIDPTGAGSSRMSLSRYENGDSLPGLRELRLISFATRIPLSTLVYRERIDPMSAYKLELEMRITDTVMGSVTADGVIKQTAEQSPESDEAYLQLLVEVKQSQ
jgi:transcriptional regulator with XRE-family HTH domain